MGNATITEQISRSLVMLRAAREGNACDGARGEPFWRSRLDYLLDEYGRRLREGV